MPTTDVLAHYESIRADQEHLYRHLHQHPELSGQEYGTAAEVARRLTAWGYRVDSGVGGTGVIGTLDNGRGATVLLRADMDALPIRGATGVEYASEVVVDSADGTSTPVMHACGHDVHVACLLGAARLLAEHRDAWRGTIVTLIQPAEEIGSGARGMLADGLLERMPKPDVALGQHVLPGPAGTVATRSGPVLSAADSVRVTLYGRGGHGSMPQNTVDPVILAALVVVRLQTVISRETGPTEPAVLTVGSIHAGTKSNIIADEAVLEINLRTYSLASRERILAAITRTAEAESVASGSPRKPLIEVYDSFPPTVNDEDTTTLVAAAFTARFGERAGTLALQSASEDFSDIPRAAGIPYTYWGIGGTDPERWHAAVSAERVASEIPANHSPAFLPGLQPTLQTGTEALVAAAGVWLDPVGGRTPLTEHGSGSGSDKPHPGSAC